jgi:hypothetical protein
MTIQTLGRLYKHLPAIVIAATLGAACGGGDDDSSGDPPPDYVAETAPIEGGSCEGDAMAFCDEIELDVCEAAGCRVYDERGSAICFGEVPRPCPALEEQAVCAGVPGCKWVEE